MNRKLLFSLGVFLLVILGVAAVFIVRGLFAHPTQNDFVKLDTQRTVFNVSQPAYGHILDDYAVELIDAYREDRSSEEKQSIQDQAKSTLAREHKSNTDRFERMRASRAMKDQAVAERFAEYEKQNKAALAYYDELYISTTNFTRAVAGSCSKLSKLNVGKSSYPKDYVSASNACLGQLSDAKKGSSRETSTLLGKIESMIRERKDKFQQSLDADDLEATAYKTEGLVMQLEVNERIAEYQDEYMESVQKQYETLFKNVAKADSELAKTLKEAQR